MTSSARSIDPIKYAEQICYSNERTLHFSYEMAKLYANKPGIYVEAGVAAGAQIIAMIAGAPNKTVLAFDSFEGIPLPSNRDDQYPGIRMMEKAEQESLPDPGKQILVTSGATVVPQAEFMRHVIQSGVSVKNLLVEPGWFEDTVKNWALLFDKVEISILRLDGDLYNSTYVCLQHLFPKVIEGGLVIIDDYYLSGCKAACHDYFNSIGYSPAYSYTPTTHFLK